jgi:hypothetical protein
MVFNGHTEDYIDSIDEELFTDISVMYADGMLGNRAIYEALTPITTAIFNYLRSANAPSYKQNQIFPWINEYMIDPDSEPTEQDKVNNALLTYMTAAQGFSMEKFK